MLAKKIRMICSLLLLILTLAGCGTQQTTTHKTKTPTPVGSPQPTAEKTSPQVDTPKPETMPDVTFRGKVIGVTDGDTISVLRDRQPVKVRLNGIDAPESHQDFGTQSKKTLSDLVFGKEVGIKEVDTDRYGRMVGIVFLADGTNVNYAMVYAGMAWWYR